MKCQHEAIQITAVMGKWQCISCGKVATKQYFDTIPPQTTKETPNE